LPFGDRAAGDMLIAFLPINLNASDAIRKMRAPTGRAAAGRSRAFQCAADRELSA